MALSGSYDFTIDRDGLIAGAMRALGVLDPGETPTASEITTGAEALNLMVKAWMAEDIGLWLNQKITLFMGYGEKSFDIGPTGDNASASWVKTEVSSAASSGASTIDVDSITGISSADNIGVELDDGTLQWTTVNGAPSGSTITLTAALTGSSAIDNHVYTYTTKSQRPQSIVEATLVNSSDLEIPLDIVPRTTYRSLPDKTSAGVVNQIYYDPQLTDGKLYVWPANTDVKNRILLTIKKPVMDFDASTDNAEYPVEWLRALKFNLAVEIAPEFSGSQKDLALIMGLAVESKRTASGYDVENTSVFFMPDMGA